MAYSELVALCFANVSKNERLASHVHSALHWRRLAERMKNHYYPIGLPTLALGQQRQHRDGGEKQLAVSIRQMDARRDPLTGQWECPAP
jgi:hypothetical protein